ncbi:MAG: ComEC/Rec2 family competence protein [Patescibacteria group bacterium]|nr:ComEC/Rec2 family competence protein [Patescibacteria group bacterium]
MKLKSKSKIFFASLLVFLFSIFVASFLPQKIIKHDIIFFALSLFSVALIFYFPKNKKIYITLIFFAVFFFGCWRYSIQLPKNYPDRIWHYNGAEHKIAGTIIKEPDARQTNQKLEIRIKSLDDKIKNIKGKVLVSVDLYPAFEYGDELEFICVLRSPEKYQGFAYDRYLARYDIYSVCYYPKILSHNQPVERNIIGKFYKNIYSFKNKVRLLINSSLNKNESDFARAIILGDKRALSAEVRENFSKSGLSHIAVISGLHISIIVALLMFFLIWIGLNRNFAFYASGFLLFLYIILIGAPASATRAGLMGFLLLLSLKIGRLNKIANSLLLAAAILLLINPRLLRDDIGFQLSFLAVLGIIYIYPKIKKILEKIFTFKKFKNNFFAQNTLCVFIVNTICVTLSAQIITAPILLYNFGAVSLIAPISNLLVLWLLPFLLVSLLAAIALGLIFPSLSAIFFLPAGLILKYILFIAEKFS